MTNNKVHHTNREKEHLWRYMAHSTQFCRPHSISLHGLVKVSIQRMGEVSTPQCSNSLANIHKFASNGESFNFLVHSFEGEAPITSRRAMINDVNGNVLSEVMFGLSQPLIFRNLRSFIHTVTQRLCGETCKHTSGLSRAPLKIVFDVQRSSCPA